MQRRQYVCNKQLNLSESDNRELEVGRDCSTQFRFQQRIEIEYILIVVSDSGQSRNRIKLSWLVALAGI